ncbi:MAG TPA: PQQ-binding-like beta-propeller repeat protein [Gammaproteobacteria bacterium]|nr:PQQ-binding-like beta-propeller repeat protein [Gammaproteobacteria bacterium]
MAALAWASGAAAQSAGPQSGQAAAVSGDQSQAPQSGPVFSDAQAKDGETEYTRSCQQCHGANLDDGQFAPPLTGSTFAERWAGHGVDELFGYVSTTMPPGLAGELSKTAYASLVAFLLERNGVAAGAEALPTNLETLASMRVPGKATTEQERLRSHSPGGPLSTGVELPSWPQRPNPLDDFSPVTDRMLANPQPSEWLTWRRTYDDQGFSPLREINTGNVRQLRVAWTLTLPAGPNTATPLVHDGVIFVHSYGDNVQALDAKTGNELWHYSRQLPDNVRPTGKRNLSLYGDKLYFGTSDAHVVALDAKTGSVVWDQPVADTSLGFGISGGPLAADGKIMQGINGQGPGGSYIVGLDADTGHEVWRFYTIARPGEPGGNSWNGIPLDKRTGGSVWTAGSYDPDQNLAFFGPAPTYDTGPMRDPVGKPGITNKALYTDSTIALNPDNGKLVWYFQHVPNDQWDFDWAFERQLINLPVNGEMHKVVLTAGKEAIYDALDAHTGQYLFSMDLGLQNIITAIDPETGAKTIDPALVPSRERAIMVCPHSGGAKSWIPGSINPGSDVLFVPLVESCQDLTPVPEGERGGLSTGVRFSIRPRPGSDGRYGRIEAIDLKTRKPVWIDRQRAPQTTGVLATAGGVVFAGALDRWFSAYDQATGKTLWRTRLNDVPSSAPISYSVDGKQYVAMVVGYGSPQSVTFGTLVPEIDLPVVRSSTIWVFALPASR